MTYPDWHECYIEIRKKDSHKRETEKVIIHTDGEPTERAVFAELLAYTIKKYAKGHDVYNMRLKRTLGGSQLFIGDTFYTLSFSPCNVRDPDSGRTLIHTEYLD